MDRPSYMGIAQMFAAAGQPDGLKAIFPQVPGADVYRDVVAVGGQIDADSSRSGSAWSPSPD
jgi:predicted acyl esterase